METFESPCILDHIYTQFRLAQNSTAPDLSERNCCEIWARVRTK